MKRYRAINLGRYRNPVASRATTKMETPKAKTVSNGDIGLSKFFKEPPTNFAGGIEEHERNLEDCVDFSHQAPE